ncbi:MAG: ankyrin repeat domain-containing protein [Synergistaceae bacterium]|nr:ankyrin repeat domain-containing protein [Synergistaceae bacterium]
MRKYIVCVIVLVCMAWPVSCLGADGFAVFRIGTPAQIRATLTRAPSLLRTKTPGGFTVLMAAAESNPSPEVIEYLAGLGVDVNAEMFAGMTALIWAAWKNPNPAVIETLISLGADIHHEAANGRTALDYAYHNEHLAGTNAIKYLETGKVQKRKKSSVTREQFFALCASGKPADIWSTLKANSIDPNIRNSYGKTAIMFAAEKNSDYSAVWYLYKAGADVNARDKGGRTPLMYAASANSNPDVVMILLRAGADPKIRSNLGELAADYAKLNKSLEGTDALRRLVELSR